MAAESESATPTNDVQALENLKLDEKSERSAPAEESPATTHPPARRLPFDAPAPSATVPERVQLTEEEQAKYDEVLAYMKAIGKLPTSSAKKTKETAPLSDLEKYFLSRECISRYLRATKWNVVDAKKRLEGTIVWRREYGTDTRTADVIEPEVQPPLHKALTGKQMLLGFDDFSRPCLYLIPSRQNTNPSPRQIQQLVYSLERAIDMMPQGVETLALLVDFKSSSNSKNPSAGTGRQVLHILQTHYPERLGKALVINVPTFVWIFFKLITPFIDPTTREKLKFNENLREYVPPEQLYELFGGDCHFEYVHEEFWPMYLKLAQDRRDEYFARFKAAGGEIGLSEWDLRAPTTEANGVAATANEEAPTTEVNGVAATANEEAPVEEA